MSIIITTPMKKDLNAAARQVGLNPQRRLDMRALASPYGTKSIRSLKIRVIHILHSKGYSLSEIGALLGYPNREAVSKLLQSHPPPSPHEPRVAQPRLPRTRCLPGPPRKKIAAVDAELEKLRSSK